MRSSSEETGNGANVEVAVWNRILDDDLVPELVTFGQGYA